ncbi:MAG: SdrD B-like domain-containing protein [Candidatus Zixiibacteriota bacterium]
MSKFNKLLALPLVVGLLVAGCSQQPTQPNDPKLLTRNLSAAVTVNSATLWVYVFDISPQEVRVHRATSPWDEATVTWNNFAGAYATDVFGTFTPDAIGWRSVDVTALVQGWLNGTYPNYGFLLEEGPLGLAWYHSSEGTDPALRPKLVICTPDCVTIQRGLLGTVADAAIYANFPNTAFGAQPQLVTGQVSDLEKQSLIRFEMPQIPEIAAIGDFVWHDLNLDGIQDVGEPGIPGVTVRLYDCGGQLVGTTSTDVNGYYLFGDLTPGSYFVEFVLPSGFVFSPQDQGANDAVDSDADVTTGRTICTTLEGGETDLTWDAGMYRAIGCDHTIGYWKTHAGFGPQADVVTPLLPIWLGTAGGASSIHVTNAATAVAILDQHTYGEPSNGITKLYAQLLGAKLSIASGADGSAVASTIAAADAFLASFDWNAWGSLSHSLKNSVNTWQTALDNYNNGLIGPGHCDEVPVI